MNRTYRYEIAVGALFFMAMAILAYYTVIMSHEIIEPKEQYYMTVIFPNVEGLKLTDKVKVNGVLSGSVEEIGLYKHQVMVKFRMYNIFTLYENYIIKIKSEAALGGRHVSIYPGVPVDLDGKEYREIDSFENLRGSLDDPLSSITALIDENRENIHVTFRNIREITDKINSGKGTIGRLLNKGDVHAQTDELVKELREAIEDAREQAPITSFLRAALTAF